MSRTGQGTANNDVRLPIFCQCHSSADRWHKPAHLRIREVEERTVKFPGNMLQDGPTAHFITTIAHSSPAQYPFHRGVHVEESRPNDAVRRKLNREVGR